MSDDSLAAANARAMPAVARRPSRFALPAGIAAVVLLGAGTFAAVHRPAADPASGDGLAVSTRAPTTSADLPPPPTLAAARPPGAIMPTYVPPVPQPQPVVRTATLPPPPRQVTPSLLVDLSALEPPAAATAVAKAEGAGPRLSANETFLDRVTKARPDTVGIDRMSSTDLVIPQGTIITGVLETAINSDLPGLVARGRQPRRPRLRRDHGADPARQPPDRTIF